MQFYLNLAMTSPGKGHLDIFARANADRRSSLIKFFKDNPAKRDAILAYLDGDANAKVVVLAEKVIGKMPVGGADREILKEELLGSVGEELEIIGDASAASAVGAYKEGVQEVPYELKAMQAIDDLRAKENEANEGINRVYRQEDAYNQAFNDQSEVTGVTGSPGERLKVAETAETTVKDPVNKVQVDTAFQIGKVFTRYRR